MKITYFGHSCFSIEARGKTIVVDPFISGNELAKNIDIDTIFADYILITHAHQDHVLDVEAIAKRTGATLISNFEIITYYENKGLQGHSMNHGGTWKFDFGHIHMVNAVHSSSFADGTYGGNPAGYILETKNHKVYIAGDTALHSDMKLIPEFFGELELAILPIGDNFTMGVNSAIKAAEFIKCDKILGCHYNTFGFIKINDHQAVSAFDKAGKELHLLPIGGDIKI